MVTVPTRCEEVGRAAHRELAIASITLPKIRPCFEGNCRNSSSLATAGRPALGSGVAARS